MLILIRPGLNIISGGGGISRNWRRINGITEHRGDEGVVKCISRIERNIFKFQFWVPELGWNGIGENCGSPAGGVVRAGATCRGT